MLSSGAPWALQEAVGLSRPRGSSRAPAGAPGGRRDDRHPPPGRAVRGGGQVATDDRGPWPGRDWHAVGVSTVDRPEITEIR